MSRLLFLFLFALGCLLPAVVQAATAFEGVVIRTVEDRNQLVVAPSMDADPEDHRTVHVGRGDRAIAREGWQIRGEIVPYAGGERLQRILPNKPEALGVMNRLERQLQHDTLNRGSRVFRGVGEQAPRFAMWDQHGELFLSESLRGSYSVINFIFTRCRMAEMCPAATERMHRLQRMAKEAGVEDIKLVSITIDPEFDTPGIFTAYAMDREIDGSNFFFLSGPERMAANLRAQLGVLAEPDEEEIVRHTLTTVLVDPSGRIIYRIPGSLWEPRVFLTQIERHRESNQRN